VGTTLLVTGLNLLRVRGVAKVRSDTSVTNIASQATHVKAGFRLIAKSENDFDDNWRENHCYYQWNAW